MAQNFIGCDREQKLLLPPSLHEWLPADHLAWFVIDAVESMDLAAFYAVYRADGHGRPAHEPSMMVALLMYCHAIGERWTIETARAATGTGGREVRRRSGPALSRARAARRGGRRPVLEPARSSFRASARR